jgi:integrase
MDKATETWLNAQKKSTMPVYKTYWGYFIEFMGLTGDKIIESRKTDKDYNWEKQVMDFKQWMINNKGQSDNSAKTASATVRGFFSFHRLPLQFRRSESAKLSEAKRKYEDYKFSREDLQKMVEVADLTEKYVIVVGKSFGLRAGDFLRLVRGDLEPYVEREPPISIGEKETEKKGVMAYSFIDSDAKPIIKLMLDYMSTKGYVNPTDKMLSFGDEIQLTRVLRRVAVKACIKFGNKRIRFHCLRKFLIDRLSSHMSESKWKQIVGKTISEGAYVSSESLREDYARAMSETCFRMDLDHITKRQEASEQIMSKIMAGEALTDQDKANITRYNLKWSKKAIKPEDFRGEIETQTNGGDCGENFEQISENQLLSYLKAGWQIVHRLESGEVIVKR